jgi:hypothetical protein
MTRASLRATRGHAGELWPWLMPFAIALFIIVTRGAMLERAVAGLAGIFLIVLAARRPDRALIALIVGLPFQGLVLAQLFAWGVPAAVVRPLSSWKEALGLGVVVAGVQGFRASRRRLDRLDFWGLAFVGTTSVFALAPRLFSALAPTDWAVRSLGFRASAGFVILALAARHARLPEGFVTHAARVAMWVGAIVAGIAVYEFLFSASWNDFIVNKVQYTRYQLLVTDVVPFDVADIRLYSHLGGQRFVRVGSVFANPLTLGFYLVLPLAVAIERTVRSGLRSGAGVMLAIIGTAIILTQTRAAIVAAVIVAFFALRPAAGRGSGRRWQFGMILAVLIIFALPIAGVSGLSQRAAKTTSGSEKSATDHVDSLRNGFDSVVAHPFGQGLGTSAGIGQRYQVQDATITENYYLQVGVEMGILGLGIFVALTLAMLRRLNRAAKAVPDLGISAVRGAAVGLAVGAFFLHTWIDFAVAWTLWSLAGASIGIAARSKEQTDPESADSFRAIR